MTKTRFTSALVLGLAIGACSEDDEPSMSPTTQTGANQPAAGSGGSSGSASTGASGAGGAAPTANGGSSAEAPSDDLDLDPADPAGDDDGAGNAPDAVDASAPPAAEGDAGAADTTMSFFVTSRGGGDGGNFGGIEGADELCRTLATEVSAELGAKDWRAYLSTSTENARDRIGSGPWFNAAGVLVATDVEQLHDQTPGMVTGPTGAASEENYPLNDSSIPLDETGAEVPNNPVLHDIITGTNLDGTVSPTGTCSDWTSTTGMTRNGHSNRTGGGQNPSSWNSSHDTGCGEPNPPGSNFQQGTVSAGGGRGSIYCFAAD